MALDVVTYALLRKYTDTEISRIIEGMSEGMSFKGSVANYESLPSDPVGGDLYILQDPSCKAV